MGCLVSELLGDNQYGGNQEKCHHNRHMKEILIRNIDLPSFRAVAQGSPNVFATNKVTTPLEPDPAPLIDVVAASTSVSSPPVAQLPPLLIGV